MFSQQQRHRTTALLFRTAYKYFAVKLGISDQDLKMINFSIVKRMRGISGECCGQYNLNNELISINIKILDYASDLGLIDVLAHEMIHAKQHLNGEFGFATKKEKFMWFFTTNRSVRTHKGQILEDTPYYEMLCEQEAFQNSRELTRQFLNFINTMEHYVDFPNKSEEGCLHQPLFYDSQTGNDSLCGERDAQPVSAGVCPLLLERERQIRGREQELRNV